MRNLLLVIGLSLGLVACSAPAPTGIAPRTGYQFVGATFVSPNEPGCRKMSLNPNNVSFLAKGELEGETKVLSFTAAGNAPIVSDREFLVQAKQFKSFNDKPRRMKNFRVQTLQTTFKGALCLKFDTSSQDTANNARVPGPQYVKTLDIFAAIQCARILSLT